MVGRTPEFPGKKIEPFEMKGAVVLTMSSAAVILAVGALSLLIPNTFSVENSGPAHAFTQMLYAFTYAGAIMVPLWLDFTLPVCC